MLLVVLEHGTPAGLGRHGRWTEKNIYIYIFKKKKRRWFFFHLVHLPLFHYLLPFGGCCVRAMEKETMNIFVHGFFLFWEKKIHLFGSETVLFVVKGRPNPRNKKETPKRSSVVDRATASSRPGQWRMMERIESFLLLLLLFLLLLLSLFYSFSISPHFFFFIESASTVLGFVNAMDQRRRRPWWPFNSVNYPSSLFFYFFTLDLKGEGINWAEKK